MATSPFIIYGLVDPRTGEMRYIGKSSNGMRRPNAHRKPTYLRNDKTRKANWIRSLQREGLTYEIEVLDYVNNRDELNAAERYWISESKVHGWQLTKLTDGGDGLSGAVFSEAHRAKISAVNKGRRLTEEQRLRLSIAAKNREYNPAYVAAATAAWRGSHHTESAKAKIGAAHRGKAVSAAARAKVSAANSKSVIELASGTVYKSVADAAKTLGIEHTGISKVASGRTRLKSIHGYRFEYVSP